MTVKDYLRQVWVLDAKIHRTQLKVEELKTKAIHITTIFDDVKVQGSPSADRISDTVTQWVIMEEKLVYLMDQLLNFKHKLINEIYQLDEFNHIRVLEMRYLDIYTFEQVAGEMGMDVRHVYRLHKKALEEFDNKVFRKKQEDRS